MIELIIITSVLANVATHERFRKLFDGRRGAILAFRAPRRMGMDMVCASCCGFSAGAISLPQRPICRCG